MDIKIDSTKHCFLFENAGVVLKFPSYNKSFVNSLRFTLKNHFGL